MSGEVCPGKGLFVIGPCCSFNPSSTVFPTVFTHMHISFHMAFVPILLVLLQISAASQDKEPQLISQETAVGRAVGAYDCVLE